MKPVDAATIKRMRSQVIADGDLAGRELGRRLAQQADSWLESLGSGLESGWAVMATGGFARGVLAPGSDIDVVLVHPPKVSEARVRDVAEGLWYPLWDAGLKLGPAAHTTKSLLALAADDLDTATSVLRVRCLAGDASVVADTHAAALDQWRKRPFVWLQRLLDSGRERWGKLGDVASRLEPDLKDGRGGVRDHDMIRWALQVSRDDVSSCLEAPFEDLAGPADTLLAVRCELHRATGKATNVLLLQDQDRVAEAMEFADADALMSNIAAAGQSIEWATERFWRRVDRLIRSGGRTAKPTRTEVADGVVVIDGEAHISEGADPDDPSYALRYAAAAAHHGAALSARSLRLLASRGAPPGEAWSERTRQAFISLLGAGQPMVGVVESLERYDLFSRYLPEWRVVRSLPQRNAFHTFTVDRHLLQTVANAAEFVRDVARPDLLLVGALLHDIGKGHPGDHTEVGIRLVDAICPRMGFDANDTAVVRSMVEHHLLLSETATRRDLSDARTAANCAAAVGDAMRLDLLAALTEADSKATGPSAWSDWKASLIDELVAVTHASLKGHPPLEPPPLGARQRTLAAEVSVDRPVVVHHESDGGFDLLSVAAIDHSGLFAQVAGVLSVHGLDVLGAVAATVDDIAVDEFRTVRAGHADPNWTRVEHDLRAALLGDLDIDGRIEQRLRSQARRRATAAAAARLEVLVDNDASADTSVIEVRAPDGPAVLYRVSHALSEIGLDIRSAKVATLGHEVVDVFYVTQHGAQLAAGAVETTRAAVLAALT
jgi:[protein-PII] uridylyltransferase